MKKILSAMLLSAIVVLGSCSKDKDGDNGNITNGVVTIKNMVYITTQNEVLVEIANLEGVKVDVDGDEYIYFNNKVEFTLKTPKEADCTPINSFAESLLDKNATISNPNAKIHTTLINVYPADEDYRSKYGVVAISNIKATTNTTTGKFYAGGFAYISENCKISGAFSESGTTISADLDLVKGWNTIYTDYDLSSKKATLTTGSLRQDARWVIMKGI